MRDRKLSIVPLGLCLEGEPSKEVEQIIQKLIMWPVIINGFGICYVKCFVCVVLVPQPSSRDLDYPLWDVHTHKIKKCIKKSKTYATQTMDERMVDNKMSMQHSNEQTMSVCVTRTF